MDKNVLKYVLIDLAFLAMIIFSLDQFSMFGVGLFFFLSAKFFVEVGEKIEIKDVILILAALQWIIGPILTYKFFPDDEIYYMAVDLDKYMNYVVPATYAFAIGMYLPFWRKKYKDNYYLDGIRNFFYKNKNIDLILLLIGSLSELVMDIFPANLRFVFFLFSGLRFIGLYFLFLSDRKNKRIIIILVLAWLFFVSLREALFHDLLLWLGFFVLIISFVSKPTNRQKIIYFAGILVIAVVIQTVKYAFREAILNGEQNRFYTFTKLISEKVISNNEVTQENNLKAMVLRTNQGWIIARIMRWTPEYEPFAKGETISTAIKVSLMPRFLFPDKVKAGGRTYFTRFTGKKISDNTSMGLGLLGEAYANYGVSGGVLFMFIIGVFYNFFVYRIYKIAEKHPSLIFFIPLLFLQVIKAETDFSVILNHLIKASIIVWAVFFGLRRFFNIKI